MYNPYENQGNQNTNQDRPVQNPAAPGYGTADTPYTAQTQSTSGSRGNEESADKTKAADAADIRFNTTSTSSGTSTQSSYSSQSPTHFTSGTSQGVPVGAPYTPTSSPYTQATPPGVPQSQTRSAYTWNPQGNGSQGGAPQPSAPYYVPAQQQPKKKKRSLKFGAKVLAAVLACAIVSLSSVGVFALMIQNGVVNVQSTGESNKTAAFTIYKQENNTEETTPTVTGSSMTTQEVAKALIPSVVGVQNYQVSRQNGFYFGGYSDSESGSEISPTGEGSGIIISKDGYIVTNQHVIDGATTIKVVTSEGLTYEATLVGEDTQTDLAVIKIEADQELTPAEFGSAEDLQVADQVMAIGNPGGIQLNSSVTIGYVSALNRPVTNSETGYTVNCIQTDAAINPGNSGGALVDMNGHVIGINSSKIVATDYEGLGFAIPSDTVQPIVSDLIEYGFVKDRPMLGISGQYIDRMNAMLYGLTPGYYVGQVNSTEAISSGLQRGDVITAIDDTQVTSAATLSSYIAGKKPGDTVTLTVTRTLTGQQDIAIELVLSENSGKSN